MLKPCSETHREGWSGLSRLDPTIVFIPFVFPVTILTHANAHKHAAAHTQTQPTHANAHASMHTYTSDFVFKISSFVCVSVKESNRRGKTATGGGRSGTRESKKNGESWATEQRCCEQLWHSQISPWLLSAGTWTLGLLGFGGQPRPHNPPSAPSSCLTPPWPRAEDRKIQAVPSQRLFYFACWHAAGDQGLHNGKHCRTQEKATPTPFLFPHQSILPFLLRSSFSSSSLRFPLCSSLGPTFSIPFLPLCTLPPLLFVIYLCGPTRPGTFITESLDTILKQSHQQHNGTARTHRRTHVWACVCILRSIYSLCCVLV